jgi:dipeptidyl aminopeptidase/acylaminoacyl peptidase
VKHRPPCLRYTAGLELLKTAALLFVAVSTAARGQSQFDRDYEALAATRPIHEVAIAPDGERVAWVQGASDIYVAALNDAGATPARIADGHDIAWSPGGHTLAFLSASGLYTLDAGGGMPKKLADFTGDVAEPRWSPDGRTIAVLFIENAPRAAGPLQPAGQTGEIGERIFNQRVALVDAATGAVRQVSPADLYVYEYDWSPDGKVFAATAAPGPGDNNWYVAKLYTIDARTGKASVVVTPARQIAAPRWSPDGARIAYISGLMSDEGSTGGDVFVVSAQGGEPRDVTPGLKASASAIDWLDAGRILFSEEVDGDSGFATVDLAEGHVETLWRGPGTVQVGGWAPGLSLSRDGKTSAVLRHSFGSPPEVWAGPIGAWRQISRANRDARPAWGEAKSIHWPSGGQRVQGWLLYPRGYDPARHWPLVVMPHGGPGAMERSHWPGASMGGMLAAGGYFVLYPNPRGSFGSGEAFTEGNVRDFGYGDLRDILAGVDQVVETLPVDNDRIGIAGWSYGGYMTMWAVTQTHRFRAAVAGAGVSDFQSYYGENQIDQWLIPFFGASVYDDPAVYWRSSPITFIKNVKTPTLVLVGERDAECPAAQSWEFWHALKTLGIPTRLVVYPNEGHAILTAEHQRDILHRSVAWFDLYLR